MLKILLLDTSSFYQTLSEKILINDHNREKIFVNSNYVILTFEGIHTVICMLDPANIFLISNETSDQSSLSNPQPSCGIPNLVNLNCFIFSRSV